jgi:NADPH2:quinone reductase
VGGPLFDQCMRCINWNGRVLVVGFVGGNIPKVPTNLVLLKSCQIVGVFYGAFSARFTAENEQNFAELIDMFDRGTLQAVIGAEYPLTDFVDALNCLSQRRAVGKIVVNI